MIYHVYVYIWGALQGTPYVRERYFKVNTLE